MAAVVATWTFSSSGVTSAAAVLQDGGSASDAVEAGIRTVELDENVTSTGYGGLPNAQGVLQLDAAIMTSDGTAGCVMAVEGLPAAIPLARLIMEQSPHAALAGQGAAQFGKAYGLLFRDNSQLLTPHAKARYAQFCNAQVGPRPHADGPNGMPHTDTVGMITRDNKGDIAVGCATSGMQFKAAGRVGDSPVIGAGLYADMSGAAVASGDGDQMMRHCISFLVVERMRGGEVPRDACRHAMLRVAQTDPTCQAAVAAVSRNGDVGAAATHSGFSIACWNSEMESQEVQIHKAQGVAEQAWKHSCV